MSEYGDVALGVECALPEVTAPPLESSLPGRRPRRRELLRALLSRRLRREPATDRNSRPPASDGMPRSPAADRKPPPPAADAKIA